MQSNLMKRWSVSDQVAFYSICTGYCGVYDICSILMYTKAWSLLKRQLH